MVAVAFVETAIFRGTSNGKIVHYPLTVSDVVGAFAISPDGSDILQMGSDQAYSLIDIIVVTGGTDTNFQDVFVNGLATPLKISNKSNLNTSNFRQFATAPVTFAPGSRIKLKQSA